MTSEEETKQNAIAEEAFAPFLRTAVQFSNYHSAFTDNPLKIDEYTFLTDLKRDISDILDNRLDPEFCEQEAEEIQFLNDQLRIYDEAVEALPLSFRKLVRGEIEEIEDPTIDDIRLALRSSTLAGTLEGQMQIRDLHLSNGLFELVCLFYMDESYNIPDSKLNVQKSNIMSNHTIRRVTSSEDFKNIKIKYQEEYEMDITELTFEIQKTNSYFKKLQEEINQGPSWERRKDYLGLAYQYNKFLQEKMKTSIDECLKPIREIMSEKMNDNTKAKVAGYVSGYIFDFLFRIRKLDK